MLTYIHYCKWYNYFFLSVIQSPYFPLKMFIYFCFSAINKSYYQVFKLAHVFKFIFPLFCFECNISTPFGSSRILNYFVFFLPLSRNFVPQMSFYILHISIFYSVLLILQYLKLELSIFLNRSLVFSHFLIEVFMV